MCVVGWHIAVQGPLVCAGGHAKDNWRAGILRMRPGSPVC